MSQETPPAASPLFSRIRAYFAAHSFARRCVSTFSLFLLLFLVIYFGGIYGAVALITLVSSLALYEFYKLTQHFGGQPRTVLGVVLGTALVPFFFYATSRPSNEVDTQGAIPLMLAFSALVFLFGIFLMIKKSVPAVAKGLATLWGLLYIPFTVGFYAILAGLYGMNGVLLCVWIVLAAKFTDIGGLLGGMFFGKHKLAPNVSPKKTWEGVVGGLILSAAGSAALIWAFRHFGAWDELSVLWLGKLSMFTPGVAAIYALPIAAVSIVSDLIESIIKRLAGNKDSGATIPGIGGALDLLDSLIFVAPVGFLIVEYALS